MPNQTQQIPRHGLPDMQGTCASEVPCFFTYLCGWDPPQVVTARAISTSPVGLMPSASYRYARIMADLFDAIEDGSLGDVQKLLAGGADPNVQKQGYTALRCAIGDENVAVVKALIEAGADVNGVSDDDGMPDLMFAVNVGVLGIVEALLSADADPNCTDSSGRTPLMEAAGQRGTTKLVQLLLDAGADKSLKDEDGETALDHAQTWENGRIVKLLK